MRIEASCRIKAPKSKCFEVFSDLKNLPNIVTAIKQIEILTDGDIGKGTKFKETRVMFGSESSEVMEIVAFEPPNYLREEAHSNGLHYISEWTFSEDNGETLVGVSLTIVAKSFTGNFMKLLFFFLKGTMKKAFLTDMEEIKKAAF